MSKKFKVAFKRSIIISEIFIALASLFSDDYFVSFFAGTIFAILISFLIALLVAVTNSKGNKKNTTTDINKDTQNFTYNKSDDYEKQAIFYYNEATYSGYRKALDLFSKAIICSTEKKHSLYYYRANVHLKLNILHNALDDINTALKYLHEQDTENITKYLYTKGLIIQKTSSDEDIIGFWKYLISFSKYKCNDCGKIRNKNLSYCTCGSRNFTVIDNEYINNAKIMLENAETNTIKNYVQNIHDVVYNKYFIAKQSIYNVFSAFYAKKKLEVAEENYELGLKEFYTENLDKAKEYFEYALSLAPYNKKYKECLKQIKKEENKNINNQTLNDKDFSNNTDKIEYSVEETATLKKLEVLDDAKKLHEIGCELFKKGKNNLAIKFFDKAININPQNDIYYNNRACAYSELEQEKALEDYSSAIKYNPKNPSYYYQRAFINYKLNRFNEAISDYYDTLTYRNENITLQMLHEVYYSMAICQYQTKMDFERDLANAQFLNSESISYFMLQANITKEEIRKFESFYNKLQEQALHENKTKIEILDERLSLLFVAIAGDMLNDEEYSNAMKTLNRALIINPNLSEGIMLRALCNYFTKEYEKALKDINILIDNNFKVSNCYSLQGTILARIGNNEDAIDSFTKAIELYIEEQNYVAETFFLRGLSYVQATNEADLLKSFTDFAIAILLDGEYLERIESTLESGLYNSVIGGVKIITEALNQIDLPINELIPFILQSNFYANSNSNFNIEQQITNKIRKIDI